MVNVCEKLQIECVCVCLYLNSVPLLLQTADALLEGSAASLLLFQGRPQLLLQSMALCCQLAHPDLNTQTQTCVTCVGLCNC